MLNYFEINEAKKFLEKFVKTTKLETSEQKTPSEVFKQTSSMEQAVVATEDTSNLSSLIYKEDRLNEILKKTCLRAGFKLGLLTDYSGLPVAFYNLTDPELLSAISSIIIEMREKIRKFFSNYTIDYITFEIDSFDKLVVRIIDVSMKKYLLIYIMPQSIDGKEEIIISSKMLEKEIER